LVIEIYYLSGLWKLELEMKKSWPQPFLLYKAYVIVASKSSILLLVKN